MQTHKSAHETRGGERVQATRFRLIRWNVYTTSSKWDLSRSKITSYAIHQYWKRRLKKSSFLPSFYEQTMAREEVEVEQITCSVVRPAIYIYRQSKSHDDETKAKNTFGEWETCWNFFDLSSSSSFRTNINERKKREVSSELRSFFNSQVIAICELLDASRTTHASFSSICLCTHDA